MNHLVYTISSRLSLRQPQRRPLKILDQITEISPLKKVADIAAALKVIQSEFPSLCFALAKGGGKACWMAAFFSYLHRAHGINTF